MRSDTQIDYRERLLRVMVYIQNHLDDPLPLEGLAKVACFSPYQKLNFLSSMSGGAAGAVLPGCGEVRVSIARARAGGVIVSASIMAYLRSPRSGACCGAGPGR